MFSSTFPTALRGKRLIPHILPIRKLRSERGEAFPKSRSMEGRMQAHLEAEPPRSLWDAGNYPLPGRAPNGPMPSGLMVATGLLG